MSLEHTKQYRVVTLNESDVLGALEPIVLFDSDGASFTGGSGSFDISAIPNEKLLAWASGDFTIDENGKMEWGFGETPGGVEGQKITLKHREKGSRGGTDLHISSADLEYRVSISVGSDTYDVFGNLQGAYASLINDGYTDGSGDGMGVWGEGDQGYMFLEASPYLQLYTYSNHPDGASVFRIHGSDPTRPIAPSDFNIDAYGGMSWANTDFDFNTFQTIGEYVELKPTSNFKNLEMPRPGSGIRLRSPNGNTYKTLTIDNSGALALL